MLSVLYADWLKLSLTYKPFMLSVIILNVVMLSVMDHFNLQCNRSWIPMQNIDCHRPTPILKVQVLLQHKYRSIHTHREQTYTTKTSTCTRSSDMGLTSPEGQKLECFESIAKNTFLSTMKIKWAHNVLNSLTRYFILLYVYATISKLSSDVTEIKLFKNSH
jgi:hypothetical protein